MSNETGATDAQIEAAVRTKYETTSFMAKELPWNRMNPDLRKTSREMFVRDAAQWLVKPTDRIVSVDDLERVIKLVNAIDEWRSTELGNRDADGLLALYAQQFAPAADRIRALIGGE